MITFILFSVIVVIVTILYTLWGLIFRVMTNPPKLFALNKLESYQWEYFSKTAAPRWFARSGVPLAIINWIVAYNIAGSVSFKEIFATDISLFGKLLLSFSSYLDFFIGLGTSYILIFIVELIVSILVLRFKASSRPEIEIVPTTGNFNDSSNSAPDNTPKEGQKQITD